MRFSPIAFGILPIVLGGALSAVLTGCSTAYRDSMRAGQDTVVSKVFLTDFNLAWQATLDALKSYRLDVLNKEGGFVQTRWTENTAEKSFVDSFGAAASYLKAQLRLKVTVAKGFYEGKQSVRVSVQKEQVVQGDVLEGWKPIESDSIDENTFLYRVGRIIYLKKIISKVEEDRTKKELEKVGL